MTQPASLLPAPDGIYVLCGQGAQAAVAECRKRPAPPGYELSFAGPDASLAERTYLAEHGPFSLVDHPNRESLRAQAQVWLLQRRFSASPEVLDFQRPWTTRVQWLLDRTPAGLISLEGQPMLVLSRMHEASAWTASKQTEGVCFQSDAHATLRWQTLVARLSFGRGLRLAPYRWLEGGCLDEGMPPKLPGRLGDGPVRVDVAFSPQTQTPLGLKVCASS